jgi:hypothetical protein
MKFVSGWTRVAAFGASLAVLAAGVPASAAVTPPFDLLPAGPAPTTIPYAIGARIFYQGHMYNIPATNNTTLMSIQPYHGNVLISLFDSGTADFVGPVGMIGPTSPWRVLKDGVDLTPDATLAGQLIAASYGTEIYIIDTSTGRIVARLPKSDVSAHGAAAGPKVLVTSSGTSNTTTQVLWDPATGATIALGTFPGAKYSVAQRRSPGWLWRDLGGGCFARVTVADPLATGTRVCTTDDPQSPAPLLSFDGTTAIAVRNGRLVAVSVDSGQVLSTGTLAAIPRTADNKRDVLPAMWETASTYIASAAWDGQLALVRCRTSDGRCERIVRSYIRGNISWIAAGW